MKSKRDFVSSEVKEKIRESVVRTGNKSATALELDLPRATIVRYSKGLMGSPLGGGMNPLHAARREARRDGTNLSVRT